MSRNTEHRGTTLRMAVTGVVLAISVLAVLFLMVHVASGANGTILVATNRYVILDDWRTGGALGPGFSNPGANHSSQNSFTGINTKINATALFIDDTGSPLNGRTITFNLYMPNGTELAAARVNATTDAYGLANFSFDLDNRNYYGNWTVKASNGSVNDSTGFIYNWWGCGISNCNSGHATDNPTGTLPKNSPYLSGRESPSWTDHNNTAYNCTDCHQSFDGKPGSNTRDDANHTLKTQDVHRNITCNNPNCHMAITSHAVTATGGAVIGSCSNAVCHTLSNRSDISNKSTLNNSNKTIAHSEYSENNGTDFNGTFHTPNSTVPCIICHGPMHNITKPDASLRFIRNNNTEDSQCTACHSSYNKHNGSVNCTLCHSDDVHYIQVFSENAGTFVNATGPTSPPRGNCTNCHQNASFLSLLRWNQTSNPKGGNYTGRAAPIIPAPLKHSSNSSNGSLWGNYWNWSQSASSSCYYCHNDTKHNSTAIGKIGVLLSPFNVRNGTSFATSDWCSDCHYNNSVNVDYKGNLWTQAPPLITSNNTGKNYWVNHTNFVGFGYNDSQCKACHDLNGSYTATTLNYSHSLDEGNAGPNCIWCHNLVTGLVAAPVGINFTAMNASVHFGMNSNNATAQGYAPVIGACWACHDSDGNVTSGHPDRYRSPKTCVECHLGTGVYNASAYNAMIVSEHYLGGANIKTGNSTSNIASCINCHENVSEMILNNGDTDTGSFPGDNVRLNGGNISFYHYGKDRASQLRQGASANCTYCHRNSSTAFGIAMLDPAYNRSIQNHSDYGTNPGCTDSNCHNTGWLHNSTLNKPAFSLPNSTYCLGCHGSDGAGGTNYSGAITGYKEKHSGSVNCTQCHLNTSRSIHPARYLQKDGTSWSNTTSNAVNCTDCHQAILSVNFSGAPIIPSVLKHSSNLSNGSLWNSTPYWGSNIGACIYCHNDTKHRTDALGRISNLTANPNNTKNGSLASTSWCADCHYNVTLNTNYRGSLWYPVPPLITANNTGSGSWKNHSGYLGSGYKDSDCKICHALNGTYAETSLNYSHSLDEGVDGGPNCISCHNTGGSAGQGRLVNFTAANSTGAIHRNLNNGTDAGVLSAENRKCWGCHQSDGTKPGEHPDLKDNTSLTGMKAYRCADCHVEGGIVSTMQPSVYQNATKVYKHYPGKAFAGAKIHSTNFTAGSCQVCHNNSVVYNNIAANINATVSHYSVLSNLMPTANSSSCASCHNSATSYGVPKQLVNPAIHSMGSACQASCHNPFYYNTTKINPIDLHNASSGIRYTCYVQDCHVARAR